MNVAVVEAVSNIDRNWFELHPSARCYVRPFIPGETPPEIPIDANHVIVVQMFQGARVRLPVKLFRDDDGQLTEIVHLVTLERWSVLESGQLLPAKGTRRPIWEALASGDAQQLLQAGFAVERNGGAK